MPYPTSRLTRAFAVLLLATATTSGATHSLDAARVALALRAQDPPPAKCCFTNPAFAGTCEVEPTKDESCGSILGYLNNPMSQGKAYCGNTTVRGGWKSAACQPKE